MYFYKKNLVSGAKRIEEAFYIIFMFLYNKNILEYAQIARNGTESKIPYIESHSKLHESMITIRTIFQRILKYVFVIK